jgi:hypothetical protein
VWIYTFKTSCGWPFIFSGEQALKAKVISSRSAARTVSDALLLSHHRNPKRALGYVKAKGSLGKSLVRKIIAFFVQNRRIDSGKRLPQPHRRFSLCLKAR